MRGTFHVEAHSIEHILMTDAALRIARDLKRQRRATGGHVGPIVGPTGGRADAVPLEVPGGSYVIPADVVSGLGEGNTDAGMEVLEEMFGDGGAPAAQAGGDGGDGVPIYAAHGEYVISPERVLSIGGGDADKGHKELDGFVVLMRKKIIKTMEKLPGPAKK